MSTKEKPVAAPEPEDKEAKTTGTPEGKTKLARQKYVTQCRWGIGRKEVSYAQNRPISQIASEKPVEPVATDEAGYIILMAKWAGQPDPSGNEFNGEGTTGSFLHNLPTVTEAELEAGDIVVFGGGIGHSAAVVTEKNKGDWQALSLIAERNEVVEVDLATEAMNWPEPMTFLRFIMP
jgi:hypothetical protein